MLTCLAKSSPSKVEAVRSSETSAKFYLSERRYIPLSFFGEDTTLRWADLPVFRITLLILSTQSVEESMAWPPCVWSRVTKRCFSYCEKNREYKKESLGNALPAVSSTFL
jgi:hypothetical protein